MGGCKSIFVDSSQWCTGKCKTPCSPRKEERLRKGEREGDGKEKKKKKKEEEEEEEGRERKGGEEGGGGREAVKEGRNKGRKGEGKEERKRMEENKETRNRRFCLAIVCQLPWYKCSQYQWSISNCVSMRYHGMRTWETDVHHLLLQKYSLAPEYHWL